MHSFRRYIATRCRKITLETTFYKFSIFSGSPFNHFQPPFRIWRHSYTTLVLGVDYTKGAWPAYWPTPKGWKRLQNGEKADKPSVTWEKRFVVQINIMRRSDKGIVAISCSISDIFLNVLLQFYFYFLLNADTSTVYI